MPKPRKLLTYSYDSEGFNPPAPVLKVSWSAPVSLPGRELECPALIDSGADITVIPRKIAAQLKLKYVDELSVCAFEGAPRKVFVYSAKIILKDWETLIIRVITSENEYALIGRDLLNRWSVLLKGPQKILKFSR